MLGLKLEYLLFVFAASCGVLQLAAVRGKLRGMMFFRQVVLSYIFIALTIGGSFLWFFGGENRNVPGLEGAQQFYLFIAAAFSALVFTLALSSLIKWREGKGRKCAGEEGLEALKEMPYFQTLIQSLRLRRRRDVSDTGGE